VRKAPFAETENGERREQENRRNPGFRADAAFRTNPGAVGDAAEIADRESVHRVMVSDALRFALLAPNIVKKALEGELPRTMSLETLQRRILPLDWEKQLWGILRPD